MKHPEEGELPPEVPAPIKMFRFAAPPSPAMP